MTNFCPHSLHQNLANAVEHEAEMKKTVCRQVWSRDTRYPGMITYQKTYTGSLTIVYASDTLDDMDLKPVDANPVI